MDKRDELVEAALRVVYTDFKEYVKDQAREHTIANMGQNLKDFILCSGHKPEQLVSSAFGQFHRNCESDEDADGVMVEYRWWLKKAEKDCKAVVKKKLPMTLENSRMAWEKKGPFAKKGV